MDGLDGHDDEASELKHCGKSSNEDELVLFEERLSKVVDLGDQGSKAYKDLHSDVKGIFICDVLQAVILRLFDICELIDIIDDLIARDVHAMWAKLLTKKSESSQICLFWESSENT